MPQRSILETDLFVDKAKEREAMMQMFTNQEEAHDAYGGNSLPKHSDGDSSSMFDRMHDGAGRQNSSEIDFDLTKTGKSGMPKQVSFAKKRSSLKNNQKGSGKVITKQNLAQAASDFAQDDMSNMLAKLEHMKVRTQEVEDKVTHGFAVEDSKLLEAIMEHMLLHWDDIMVCLIDELIEEEVIELNKIDDIRRIKEQG